MRKLLLLTTALFAILFSTTTAHAQKGSTALGLRFSPDGLGFSGKFGLDRNWIFEAQVNAGGVFGYEGESFNVVGLFEYHIALPEPSFQAYLGAGAHVGAWDHPWRHDGRWRDGAEPIFGIDGIAGIQYKFKTAPISVSFDFKPAVNFVARPDFFPHNMFGFGLRFHL